MRILELDGLDELFARLRDRGYAVVDRRASRTIGSNGGRVIDPRIRPKRARPSEIWGLRLNRRARRTRKAS